MIAVITFILGVLLGMWLGKHPDDARAYSEAAWTRVTGLFHKKLPDYPGGSNKFIWILWACAKLREERNIEPIAPKLRLRRL